MSAADRFIDTDVLLYLLSGDTRKSSLAEATVAKGGTVSVQVLNEFAAVASRRFQMSICEIADVLSGIRANCSVVPVDQDAHDLGMTFVERYKLRVFDAILLASAMLADCRTFLSEDLQHGQEYLDQLTVINPFIQSAGRTRR